MRGSSVIPRFELVVFTRVLCKPDDTHRGQALDDSIFPCQGSHAPSRTPCHPSAPSEVDNHRDHSRGHTRPEDDRLRRSGFTTPLSKTQLRLILFHCSLPPFVPLPLPWALVNTDTLATPRPSSNSRVARSFTHVLRLK